MLIFCVLNGRWTHISAGFARRSKTIPPIRDTCRPSTGLDIDLVTAHEDAISVITLLVIGTMIFIAAALMITYAVSKRLTAPLHRLSNCFPFRMRSSGLASWWKISTCSPRPKSISFPWRWKPWIFLHCLRKSSIVSAKMRRHDRCGEQVRRRDCLHREAADQRHGSSRMTISMNHAEGSILQRNRKRRT